MMGRQDGVQDQLFYSFNLTITFRKRTCCAALIGTSSSTVYAGTPSGPFMVTFLY
jgi:hypothetical protein